MARPRVSRKMVSRKPRKSKRTPKVSKLAKQVKNLQMQNNAEKKHYGPVFMTDLEGASTIPVGLSNGTNADGGGSIVELRPALTQSVGAADRIGNSIKLHAMHLKIALAGQSAQSNNSTLVFEVYKVNGNKPYDGTNKGWSYLGSDLFKKDPLTQLYPVDTSRNPNYFSQFTLLRRKRISTPQDNAGSSNFIRKFNIGIKFKNYHMRWDDSGYCNTQLILVVRASNGNRSVATASLTGQGMLGLNTAVNTGFVFNCIADYYFYDN